MKMNRLLIAACVMAFSFFFSQTASAQVEIGVRVAPSVSSQRITARDEYNLDNDGSKLNLGVGLVVDYFFGANYAFGTGLMYNTKGAKIAYDHTFTDGSGGTTRISGRDKIGLQYLEIPLTVKLFTNEIAPATKMYFQVGPSLNTLLGARFNGEKVDASGDKFTKRFSTFEVDILVGAGIERQLGQSTKLIAGLSYHRGLTDVDKYYEKRLSDKKIELRNSTVALDLGIKF